MNDFSWIAPLKEAVLLLFFLVFSGIIAWTYSLRNPEELANIPLRDEENPV